jgi:YfiH family protein
VFVHREHVGDRVTIAFTDVHLDLSEDAPALAESLRFLEDALGVEVARMRQMHGAAVADVDAVGAEPPEADGLVTTVPGVALLTRAADCVPVLLADQESGVVGAAHAGRLGTMLGVVTRVVERMRSAGAGEITAWVGPHICGRCYEVPEEMREEVAAVVSATRGETRWGTPSLDLGAGVVAQLEAADCTVVDLGQCTYERPELPSYRRDGSVAGRFGGLVWLTRE